jgi:imidazolonepropionase-like amidohydrolase
MHAIRARHAFDGDRFLPDGATVFVDGARIAGLETGRVEVPAGIELAEYAGTVLPGLIDCHTHLVADSTPGGLERAGAFSDDELDSVIERSLREHATAGVTTVRDLGDRGYRTLAWRERPGLPRVVAAGPPLTTPGGHCHFLGGAVGDLRDAVSEHAERGVDLIKVMASGGMTTLGTDVLGAQFTEAELAGLVEEAHRVGLPVVAHAHSLVGARTALAARVDGIEHFTCLTADGPRIEDDLLQDAARAGVYVDLTTGNDRSVDALLELRPPPALGALMAHLGFTTFAEFYASRISLFTRLREQGVQVVAGVDSGMAPMKRHGNARFVVGDLVEGGYPIAEALAAATSIAAVACGAGGVTGRLAAGRAADVLVVAGDLERDVTALATPELVLVRGRPVSL